MQLIEDCESPKKLPSFTRNATNLRKLNLRECSTLVKLPSSIEYATSPEELNLSDCSSLENHPSTIGNLQKLSDLNLNGCSELEALPTNINLESLTKLELSLPFRKESHGISPNIEDLYLCGTAINFKEFLKKFPHAFNSIIELDLKCTKLQELGPWIKGFSRLHQLKINSELLSIRGLVVLPGVEVPDYFTNSASQSSVTVKLVCKDAFCVHARVNCSITSKENARTTIVQDLKRLSSDHLYIFQFGVKDVTSTELDFNFWLDHNARGWKILECGVLQLLELLDDNYEALDMEIDDNESSSKRRRL